MRGGLISVQPKKRTVRQRDMGHGSYNRLTPSMMLGLAAPHTWVASIMPVLVAYCMVSVRNGQPSPLLAIIVLVIAILMQSSVNTLNDYFDFKKGVDSRDDNLEPSDAVLLYNNINPKSALAFSISLLVVALLLGIIVIVFGCLVSWIGAFFAYGFGQLIENTDEIRKNTAK